MLTKKSAGFLAAVLIGGVASSAAGCGDDEGVGGAGGAGGAPTTKTSTTGAPTSTSGMMTNSSNSTGGPTSSSATGQGSTGSTGTGSSGSTSTGSSGSTSTGSSGSTSTGSSGSTSTGSSGSTSTGSSGSTGTGMGTASSSTGMTLCELPDTTAPTTCAEACSDLYDCGALVCNGMQNCPGVTGDPNEKTQFLQICLPTCMNQMALIQVVDPANCDDTVATISAVSAQFDNVCQNGLP